MIMTNNTLKLNENLFLILKDQKLYLWNYDSHEQYEIEESYLSIMLNPASAKSSEELEKLEELVMTGIFIPTEKDQLTWKWDTLSRIFHVGTMAEMPANFEINPTLSATSYIEYCSSIQDEAPWAAFNYSVGEGDIELSKERENANTTLLEVLAKRASSRSFTGEEISFSDISTIISETFRYRNHDLDLYEKKGLYTPTFRRSSSSGGSLQASECYLIARRVQGLKAGIYHYRSHKDTLGFIAELPEDFSFGKYNGGQMFSDDLSAEIVITSRFDKLAWKYQQSRAYRVALFDVGHLSQTAQLLATSLGKLTWLTGLFYDVDLKKLLKIDPLSNEFPLLVLGLGTGAPYPFASYLETKK